MEEWDKPDKGKHISKNLFGFYRLQEPKNSVAEVPKVNAAIASLASDMVTPSEGEFFPKDQTGKWRPLS